MHVFPEVICKSSVICFASLLVRAPHIIRTGQLKRCKNHSVTVVSKILCTILTCKNLSFARVHWSRPHEMWNPHI